MATQNLRQRQKVAEESKSGLDSSERAVDGHPGGDIRHGGPAQLLRFFVFLTYFLSSVCT